MHNGQTGQDEECQAQGRGIDQNVSDCQSPIELEDSFSYHVLILRSVGVSVNYHEGVIPIYTIGLV